MSHATAKKWIEEQEWFKPENRGHYSERCKKNHCKCIDPKYWIYKDK